MVKNESVTFLKGGTEIVLIEKKVHKVCEFAIKGRAATRAVSLRNHTFAETWAMMKFFGNVFHILFHGVNS